MVKAKGERGHDTEIDRREFNGHTLVLLEDRGRMKPDGTSRQNIIAVESVSEDGKKSLGQKRYITDLVRKRGYANSKEGARAIFLSPGGFKGMLGEHWIGFREKETLGEYSAAV